MQKVSKDSNYAKLEGGGGASKFWWTKDFGFEKIQSGSTGTRWSFFACFVVYQSMFYTNNYILSWSHYVLAMKPGTWINQSNTNLKVQYSRFENFTTCLVDIKTITWKFRILNSKYFRVIYSWSLYFLKKVGYFLIFYYFCMFVNKHFICFGCLYLKK